MTCSIVQRSALGTSAQFVGHLGTGTGCAPVPQLPSTALGDTGRGGDPLVTEFRLELEAKDFSDFAHGTPLGWHRAPLVKTRQLASKKKDS